MRRTLFEASDLPRSTDLRLSGDESDGQRIRAEDSVIDPKFNNLHSCHTSHLRLVRVLPERKQEVSITGKGLPGSDVDFWDGTQVGSSSSTSRSSHRVARNRQIIHPY